MATQLDPAGRAVRVGPIVVRAPGLRGSADVLSVGTHGSRAPAMGTQELARAVAAADVSEQYTLELSALRSAPQPGGGRSRSSETIEVDVPAPSTDRGQMLLLVEEDGGLSWHFPETSRGPSTRARQTVTYRIPGAIVPARGGGASRGLVTAVGSKVLKFFSFLLRPLVARAGTAITRDWETKHRKARFRAFTPDDYCLDSASDLDAAGWARMTGGRALLFVHGTASSSHLAFAQLSPDVLRELSRRYGGRVLALDHHSLWLTPGANVRTAVDSIPAGLELEFDIVAHSRGGLVARELFERREENGTPDTVQVRTLVMVAVPNTGTALAQRANHRKWLDLVTNMAQLIPDNPVTDILVIALEVAKELAAGVFDGLEGLAAMDPDGPEIAGLNAVAAPEVTYRALSTDFEPPKGSALARKLHDIAFDALFSGAPNDLVVPTAPVRAIPGRSRLDPPGALEFARDADVDHSSFFSRPEVAQKLLEWLPG